MNALSSDIQSALIAYSRSLVMVDQSEIDAMLIFAQAQAETVLDGAVEVIS